MSDARLRIAKELIEILAKNSCSSVGSVSEDRDMIAVKRIIEAARANYVLPSFCAEMNTRASKCINCIVDHNPPEICRKKFEASLAEEDDIEWDTD